MSIRNKLSRKGYILVKKKYSKTEIDKIKKELTVKPYHNPDYGSPPNSFPIYLEGEHKLYLPRYYGITCIGKPDKLDIKEGNKSDMCFKKELKDYQIPCVSKMMKSCREKGGGILSVPCGYGKCLGKDTPILMYDGKIKMVQNVKPCDIIMGDDCEPRNVLSICSGIETMYEIQQSIGSNYVVNESHILTVYIDNILMDISLKDCLEIQKTKQIIGCHKCVEFANKYDISKEEIWKFVVKHKSGSIPMRYKCASIKSRRMFAEYYMSYYGEENSLMFLDRDKKLKQDIIFIFSSVGIKLVYTKVGSNLDIPILKIVDDNYINKISIIKLNKNKYYGFEIDGNRRFMLGDCTITHNTVVALYLACELKSKTLVIVHKEFLVNQWKDRIEEFTTAKVGIIQQKKVEIEGKDIVIGMLQSISQRKYPKEIFDTFNLVIIDECHHTSAETFSKALPLISTKYNIGLSATPTRKDGLSKVFKWFLGDIEFLIKKREISNVNVIVYNCFSNSIFYKECFNKIGKINIPLNINNIAEFEERNKFITNLIPDLIKNNRNILILSERRQHIINLKKMILELGICTAGLYIGGMKQLDLENSEKMDIILATYQMASEAFDCKKLDTLIMVTPKGDIVQSVGRILRKQHEKTSPLIIDIVDNFSIFCSQGKKRASYYKKNKYNIIYKKVIENNIMIENDNIMIENDNIMIENDNKIKNNSINEINDIFLEDD